ncbi:hypothetical protein GGI64_005923 [Rhizobium leguminosarum]|uniref:Uncharacterized protein n=1 Tax=Rhizobium leguminosarum TaxID=384 RepID=A0A7Z0E5P4_RHILE|nr:hypothetical protein [Rhizobium leguminosarum]NYJ14822.1 hypothetical protein [Rhizobium leguminosarum]
MQHLKMLQQQTAWIEEPIAADPAASEKQKKRAQPAFPLRPYRSDREAASSSVVSIAPVRSRGSSLVRPAATESCSCRSSRDYV